MQFALQPQGGRRSKALIETGEEEEEEAVLLIPVVGW